MTSEERDLWSAFNAEMLAYARRLARGEAEDIPETRPRPRWSEGFRLETKPAPHDGGYRNAPSDYRGPRTL
jgi:hypothetical protein